MRLSAPSAAAIAAVLAAVLLIFRAPDVFSNPQFWAEDGQVFWLEAYRDGAWALRQPYNGYLHLAPRLIALVTSWFSPVWAPTLYVTGATLLTAWAASIAATAVPNPWLGLSLALGLLLMPMPSGELWATPTNIQWLLAPVMALVLLSPPPQGRLARFNQFAFAGLAAMTGPFSIFALPLVAWRLLRHRDALGVLVLMAAIVQGMTMYFWPPPALETKLIDLPRLALAVTKATFGWKVASVPFGLALIVLAIMTRTDRMLRVGLLAFSAAIIAAAFVRAIPWSDTFDAFGGGTRYFFIPHVTLLWCTISLMFTAQLWVRLAAPLCTVAMFWSILDLNYIRRGPWPDMEWKRRAIDIGPRPVTIPINPPGWAIVVPERRP